MKRWLSFGSNIFSLQADLLLHKKGILSTKSWSGVGRSLSKEKSETNYKPKSDSCAAVTVSKILSSPWDRIVTIVANTKQNCFINIYFQSLRKMGFQVLSFLVCTTHSQSKIVITIVLSFSKCLFPKCLQKMKITEDILHLTVFMQSFKNDWFYSSLGMTEIYPRLLTSHQWECYLIGSEMAKLELDNVIYMVKQSYLIYCNMFIETFFYKIFIKVSVGCHIMWFYSYIIHQIAFSNLLAVLVHQKMEM